MVQLPILLANCLALLTVATPIDKRAGGPAATPIPSTCTVINPLPKASCGTGNVNGYMPSSNFTAANSLYQAYFSSSLSVSDQWTQCSEQCYGYGTPGTCKSALLAYNVPTPEGYYGTAGGDLETACLLYSAYLSPNDFVRAPAGQYMNATAGDIFCGYPS